ncbi:VOC family protein [Bacillus sp. FJAT-45350]|uniref:VOC family protein n=1 Tax=Bacillus sp. FJAT-45350 TaxID=2011014 RepID=UPI0015C94B33|nr:VOC family protein [Bacillus sp. FJAT-45350]
MSKTLLGNNTVNQIAFVVNDIDAACEAFSTLLGIPKPDWFLTGERDVSQVVYNGKPSDAQSKLCFINTPSVQIELIEPNQEPSTMRDFLGTIGEGIHHIAFDVNSIEPAIKTVEEHGFPVVQTGNFTSSNGCYAYADTQETYKTLIELLERETPYEPISLDEKNSLLGTTKLTQMAVVVRDLDKVAEAYCNLLGVEKPAIVHAGDPTVTQVVHRGKQTDARGRFMFIDTPLIQIELIEPGDSPSTWNEFLETNGEGIHHISFNVNDLEEKVALLEELGYPVIQKGNFFNGNGRYAYIDTTSTFKVIIELLEKYDS